MRYKLVVGLALFMALGALPGCNGTTLFGGDDPSASQAPPGISYRVTDGDFAAAGRQAAAYCQQFGKKAALASQDKDAKSDSVIAIYSCS